MSHPQHLPDVLQGLLDHVQQLHMAHTVQCAAFVALAQHLAAQGNADLPMLASDLDTLAQVQNEPGWRSGLQELSGALRLAHGLPSVRQK